MSSTLVANAERWAALRRFVERWYATPLGAGGGLSEREIQQAEARLGRALPAEVREWFLLVGARFRDTNQDRPVRLHQLEVHENRMPLWWENQGNWSFDVELDTDGEEPWISVDSSEPDWRRRVPLTEGLLGMVYSDTLVGAAWAHGVGPLGPLKAGVVGGFCESLSRDAAARVAALPALAVMTNPHFVTPLRGHDALVIRSHDAGMRDWMAATDEAHAEAASILQLRRES
jgi:hypothetical protein